ncbi:MAG: hypothetical protein QOD99_2347 [Chthoniobacter sp.]|nr:hypothetical protein [Chthoniobacter sp.]
MSNTSPNGELHAPTQPDDLFSSLETLRLDPKMSEGPTVSKALVTIPVRKPSKEWFVRTHPDAANYAIDTMVLELKEDGEIYLIHPSLRDALFDESTVHNKRLWLAVTRQGDYFVWPTRLPGFDGKLDSWNQSALEAMQLATSKWVRLSANRRLGGYDIAVAAIDQKVEWTTTPFNELLKIAFKGRVIDSLDHPVLKKLRGEV